MTAIIISALLSLPGVSGKNFDYECWQTSPGVHHCLVWTSGKNSTVRELVINGKRFHWVKKSSAAVRPD